MALALVHGAAAQALEDPMRPPHYQAAAKAVPPARKAETWTLNSILITAQRRVAVINGKRVEVGAYVGSARVVAIEATQVRLQSARRSLTLNLVPVNVKQFSRAETP